MSLKAIDTVLETIGVVKDKPLRQMYVVDITAEYKRTVSLLFDTNETAEAFAEAWNYHNRMDAYWTELRACVRTQNVY